MSATTPHCPGESNDVDDASRGFIGRLTPCVIKNSDGDIVWDNDAYSFLDSACPDTADPNLWQHGRLVSKQGLFLVIDGIYQVRGLDISNMTLIEGTHGIIVVDPLYSTECAKAALELYRANRGNRPVTGIMYTHSHVDHFGGVEALVSREGEKVPIMAPDGFLQHAVEENIYAGNAMRRRGVYMLGEPLPKSPNGQIGCGIGMADSSGTVSLIPPTVIIKETNEEHTIDGVRFVFQLTPGTEAPAGMNFYLPQRRALCVPENATHTLHNIVTPRGAVVRDAHAWSRYLNETVVLFTQDVEVLFTSHHWPTWERGNVVQYLSDQRDMYAYLHDQTLRMLNDGMTGIEIAEELTPPDALRQRWYLHGFYGSVSHDVKAIYQRYMGWFDANPAHLWEYPPVQAAQRYISCMGGVDSAVCKAETFAKQGDLRFAATLLSHAVFADPSHIVSRKALASVFDKLGVGAENAVWRNFYLTGAFELRNGVQQPANLLGTASLFRSMSVEQLLDTLCFRIHGPRAQNEFFTMELQISDLKTDWRLTVRNGALTYYGWPLGQQPADVAGWGCIITFDQLVEVVTGQKDFDDLGEIQEYGDRNLPKMLSSLLTTPNPAFAIVTP